MLDPVPLLSPLAQGAKASPTPAATAEEAGAGPFARALNEAAAQRRDDDAPPKSDDAAEDKGDAHDAAAAQRPGAGRNARMAGVVAPAAPATAPSSGPAAEESVAAPTPMGTHTPDDDTLLKTIGKELLDMAALMTGLSLPSAQGTEQPVTATGSAAARTLAVEPSLTVATDGKQELAARDAAERLTTDLAGDTLARAWSAQADARQPPVLPAADGKAVQAMLAVQVQVHAQAGAAAERGAVDLAAKSAQASLAPVATLSTPDALPAVPQLLAGIAGAPLPVHASHGASPSFHAELSAALGTPEFAPALGSQLVVLVRDGIEQAQLRLNPATMGPIEVRISLDGNQAQIDFSAAHAGTRQALQDAVPVLAGALREAGLTLTGGGVFEQPRDPRGDARPEAPQRRDADAGTGREAALLHSAPVRSPRARGVVDLYA